MNQPGNTTNDTIETVCPSYLVELSVVTSSGQEAVGDDMKNFAEQLKPYPFLRPQTKNSCDRLLFCIWGWSGIKFQVV